MSLSSQTIQDKNALATDSVLHVLLEIDIPDTPTVYIVNNTENVTWDGNEYVSFPFELDDINENSTSEIPQWIVRVSNVNRVFERYLQDYDLYLKLNGLDGNEINCVIRVVNSNDLANTTPILEYNAVLLQPTTSPIWATFKLSANSPYKKQFPPRRIMKNFCEWKFKGTQCGYSGAETECDKSLTRCRVLGNSPRYGGFAGVGSRGLILA